MIGMNGGLDLLVTLSRWFTILIPDPNSSMDYRIRTISSDPLIDYIEDSTLDCKSDRLDT